jgi:ABC-2 type transport system permease protein
VEVDNAALAVTTLFRSSDDSWLDTQGGIQPDFDKWPDNGFDPGDGQEHRSYGLGVMTRGSFDSWYADRELPATLAETLSAASDKPLELLEQSPPDARLAVIGSGIFLADSVIDLQSQAAGTRYLNSLQFIQNLVDRLFEEPGLLALRGRGDYARMLDPLTRKQQQLREGATVGVMFAGVVLLFFLARLIAGRRARYLEQRLIMNDSSRTTS